MERVRLEEFCRAGLGTVVAGVGEGWLGSKMVVDIGSVCGRKKGVVFGHLARLGGFCCSPPLNKERV